MNVVGLIGQSIKAPFFFPNLPNSTSSVFDHPPAVPAAFNLLGIIPVILKPLPRETDRTPGPLYERTPIGGLSRGHET